MQVMIRQQGQGNFPAMVLMLLLWLVPAMVFAEGNTKQPSLVRTDTNTSINIEDLENVLAASSILVSLPESRTINFYDATFNTLSKSDVLLQANPEVLIAVVLLGEIQSSGQTARAGESMAWPLGVENVEVMKYDAGRFLATSPIGLSAATQANLELVAQRQERLQWWGLLERVNFNLKSPSTPGYLQSVRHNYLGNPTVLGLMRKHPDVESLTKAVAETFVEALRNGDLETVEALINPQLFFKGDIQPTSQGWTVFRQNFALMFLMDPWDSKLADAKIEPTEDVSTWRIVSPTHRYTLSLEPFDRMVFVTALEPVIKESEQ